MSALRKNGGTPFEQSLSGKLKLAPATEASTTTSTAPEQSPSATVVALPKTDPPAGSHLAGGQRDADRQVQRSSGEPYNLNAHIRSVLAELGDIGPAAVASVVMDALSDDELAAIAADLIAARVRALCSNAASSRRRSRSAKWDAVAETRERLDVLRQAVLVGDVMKPLGECSRTDLGLVVRGARLRAKVFARRARAFELLDEEMERRGAAVVADLPVEVVERVLS